MAFTISKVMYVTGPNPGDIDLFKMKRDHENVVGQGETEEDVEGGRGRVEVRGMKRIRRDPNNRTFSSDNQTIVLEPKGIGAGSETEEEKEKVVLKELEDAVAKIKTARPVGGRQHLNAVHGLRHILSTYEEPPCKLAVQAGAIPVLIEALQPPQMDSLALETTFQALWALTNVAVGSSDVVEAILPAAPILIAYINQGDHGWGMAEQSAWAVGNIAGEDLEYRQILIANGAVKPLVRLFTKSCLRNFKKATSIDTDALAAGETAAWALSILFKGQGKEVEAFLEIDGAMSAALMVLECNDFIAAHGEQMVMFQGIVQQVSWLMARVTGACAGSMTENIRREVLDAAAMRLRIVFDRMSPVEDDVSVLIPILRIISHLASFGGDEVVEYFSLDPGNDLIDIMYQCGSADRKYGLEKQVGETLKYIARLGQQPSLFILRAPTGLSILKKYLKEEPFHVRKEAAAVLDEILTQEIDRISDPSELLNHVFVGDEGSIKSMLSLIQATDVESVFLGIRFVDRMLCFIPRGREVLKRAGAIQMLEDHALTREEDLGAPMYAKVKNLVQILIE